MTTGWRASCRALCKYETLLRARAYGSNSWCVPSDRWSIEQLTPADHERLRSVRLRALSDTPAAFGTPWAEAAAWPSVVWREQLEHATTFVAVGPGVAQPTFTTKTADVGVVRCVLHAQAETASLISLWVAPEARGAGIASTLIASVLAFARRQKMGRVVLDVVDTNTPAIALYRKHGFAPNGERRAMQDPDLTEIQLERLL
jgi:ribosomal protein S18 acetylase RimI-like enzyme